MMIEGGCNGKAGVNHIRNNKGLIFIKIRITSKEHKIDSKTKLKEISIKTI